MLPGTHIYQQCASQHTGAVLPPYCRGVEDSSIALPDNKRDYTVHLLNRLLIGGEDKPTRGLMRNAVVDLHEKHKSANAALLWRTGVHHPHCNRRGPLCCIRHGAGR